MNNKKPSHKIIPGRREFIKNSIQAGMALTIVPRFVLGGKGFIAPSDQIHLGFIGTGKQARGLANQFAPITKIIASSDVDSQKLDLFSRNVQKKYAEINQKSAYKGFTTYPDFREMLERKDMDAVVVATPDHWHAVASIMAANAHKHVYCEKPLGHSVEEGRAMVKAMGKNKVILQTGSMQRSWVNFRHACELVRNGYIGDIKEVLVNVGGAAIPDDLPGEPVPAVLDWDKWVGPAPFKPFNAELSPPVEKDVFPNWRKYKEYGGGILSDWGAHMFDIAQWGLGMDHTGPVKLFPPDGKEYKSLTMVYENGILLKHEDFGRGFGVRFIGTKGVLNISRDYIDTDPANIVSAEIKPSEIHLYKSDNHYQDWLQAIRNHSQPICPAEVGHRTSSLCCIANIAYWLKRPLQWDPQLEQFKNDEEANGLAKANIRGDWKLV
ncbi:MAG: Gfo/Idh/MocA family oxidoreductase [Bacteroidetes bacterium]|nr:Gfo/Idh/MocA family oxidoreductase [Bacteroidota bacterium]